MLVGLFVSIFFSCKKINEATTLGGDLIPPVDNVTTFETDLYADANNAIFVDTTRLEYTDLVTVGSLNDQPTFGTTEARTYFNLGRPQQNYGVYPFSVNRNSTTDTLYIDSAVLSVAYISNYGDENSVLRFQVSEIAQNNGFRADSLYRLDRPNFSTTNNLLQRPDTSIKISAVKDSVRVGFKRDSSRVGNVIRFRLDSNFGKRLANYDTTNTTNGAFRTDSAFRAAFAGIEIKTSLVSGNGGLVVLSPSDVANTRLIIYYRANKSTGRDTLTSEFTHSNNGQANIINRNIAGSSASVVFNSGPAPDQTLYLQSTPGSYVSMRFPGLDSFSTTNKVIHRAELVATKLTSPLDNIFTPPARLILDRINPTRDTAFIFENDLVAGPDGSLGFSVFGGTFRTDNTYRFNISRYVQSLVTRKVRNDSLRLYAPLETKLFAANLVTTSTPTGSFIVVPNLLAPALGRVVLGGSGGSVPSQRLRLRIIYSKL